MSPEKLLSSKLGKKSGKQCPRCGRLGSFHIKEFLGEGGQIYRYWYTAHYRPAAVAENGKKGNIKWCYVGKSLPSSEPNIPSKDDPQQQQYFFKPINSESLYLNTNASGKQQHPVQLSQIRNNREREKKT
ncbi:MAG: hypothetical protein HYY22_09430 [Thaumarchaeota archaeon]|nr:hypothetical protein [Nitrososphaerota archaeon]